MYGRIVLAGSFDLMSFTYVVTHRPNAIVRMQTFLVLAGVDAAMLLCCYIAMLPCFDAAMPQSHDAAVLLHCNAALLPCCDVTKPRCCCAVVLLCCCAAVLAVSVCLSGERSSLLMTSRVTQTVERSQ